MADYHPKLRSNNPSDDYMTPKHVWEAINDYIPKDKIIWEPFYCSCSNSHTYLKELGCKDVIFKDEDFFESNHGEVIITNPPFSIRKKIIPRMKELDKPFIMIMPSNTLHTNYIRDNFKDIQIIVPRRRIQFIKADNGKICETQLNKCSFDCLYFCYKMNLPHDIIFLEPLLR